LSEAATEAETQVVDAAAVIEAASGAGAQWSLGGERQLDLNVVYMPVTAADGDDQALPSDHRTP
jgi:hypothetical protein